MDPIEKFIQDELIKNPAATGGQIVKTIFDTKSRGDAGETIDKKDRDLLSRYYKSGCARVLTTMADYRHNK